MNKTATAKNTAPTSLPGTIQTCPTLKSVVMPSRHVSVIRSYAALRPLNLKSVILFGGTFDPPHVGHRCVIDKLRQLADVVIVLPARQNPLKERKPGATDKERVQMLRLLLGKMPGVVISTTDLQRKGEDSYSINAVRELRAGLGDNTECRILFATGQDNVANFHNWKYVRELAAEAEIVPVERKGAPAVDWKMIIRAVGAEAAVRMLGRWCRTGAAKISSTELRNMLNRDHLRRSRLGCAHLNSQVSRAIENT